MNRLTGLLGVFERRKRVLYVVFVGEVAARSMHILHQIVVTFLNFKLIIRNDQLRLDQLTKVITILYEMFDCHPFRKF